MESKHLSWGKAIAKRGDNLDISWLRDESLQSDELQEPEVIAAEILERL